MIKFGSHVSMSGKEMFYGSIKEAVSYHADALMIYTGAPQNTRRKAVSEFRLDEAFQLMKDKNILMENIVVHAPYIVNLANPQDDKHQFAIDFLTQEIKRCAEMTVTKMVLHPGAHVKQGAEYGIKRIASGLNQILENTKELNVVIALETMSGKGTEVGRSFDELKAIIDLVNDKKRIKVCFDTCHVHDAGYDIINDLDNVLAEFDAKIGLNNIAVLHVNDSKNPKGASKDRHENIGLGYIGFEALNRIVNDKSFRDVPKILETPYVTKDDSSKEKIYPPYKYELKMFKNNLYNENLLTMIRNQK